jgi:1-aminocyclopropane-1-carboxylate deaminase/D-cysteine desulfhydrase-like pyridoxal-dependent ACC family enzyme
MTSRKDQPPLPGLTSQRPLLELLPKLAASAPFAELGSLPTPCEALAVGGRVVYVKRDDITSSVYGGNKVRTLESLFGVALCHGYERVVSTGAFGSNHAVATILHGARLGLRTGALLFPQPPSGAALENLRATAAHADRFVALPHWSCLPFGIGAWRRSERSAFVMPPGGATPQGALGYVSAALELALQVRASVLPQPERIVLPVGSGCTSAGLLVGLRLAQRFGLGFWHTVPLVYAVRVTPWPVTSVYRITQLAARTARWLAEQTGRPELAFSRAELAAGLVVDGRYLGRGYGRATPAGLAAMRKLDAVGLRLDPTYSAKAAAALFGGVRESGPTLFWMTKSRAMLPAADAAMESTLPARVRTWMHRAEGDE